MRLCRGPGTSSSSIASRPSTWSLAAWPGASARPPSVSVTTTATKARTASRRAIPRAGRRRWWSMSQVGLVKKYQCEVCGMLSARLRSPKTMMIRRDCPVCKEATTHHAVVVNQVQADIFAILSTSSRSSHEHGAGGYPRTPSAACIGHSIGSARPVIEGYSGDRQA